MVIPNQTTTTIMDVTISEEKKGGYISVRCPKCNNVVYSHHQKINKSGTEIKRNYACRKCKYVFETVEQIIKTDKEE